MKTKILSVSYLVAILVVFTQCVEPDAINDAKVVVGGSEMPDDAYHNGIGQNPDIGDVVGGGSTVLDELNETGGTEVALAIADVGIKDFEQIYMTMSVLTGVDPNNESRIRNTYADLTTSLPNESSVKRFNSNIQFSVFKLATEYCDVMLSNANYYNAVFTSLDMGQGIKTSETRKNALITDLTNRFWGGAAVQDASVLTSSKAELKTLLDELAADEADSGAATRKVAKGVCAAVLSTPQVTML